MKNNTENNKGNKQDIFDRIFKKTLTLSSMSVIRMINSMFGKNYALDSKIDYRWTEFVDNKLQKTLADTILTINRTDRYHFEAQMTEDRSIIFRMLEYGYSDAIRVWDSTSPADKDYYDVKLKFPMQRIIYLYSKRPVPDTVNVTLIFEDQGEFTYKIKTVNFLNESIEDINNNNMIILIPFALLKLRDSFKTDRSPANIAALKTLLWDDIIGSIEKNKSLGNITDTDATLLKNLCVTLFQHLYSDYNESKEVLSMRDQSLILEVEPYIDKYEEAMEKLAEKEKEIATKIAEKDSEIAEKDSEIAEKNSEIAALKEQLAKLTGK